MVGHHQTILEYSIINLQINHSLEIETYWALDLLKWSLLLKWLIYGNGYLKFYNRMRQKGNLADVWSSAQIQKSLKSVTYFYRLGYLHYSLDKQKILHLFWLCLYRFVENLCTTKLAVVPFMIAFRGIALNYIFSISTGRMNFLLSL